MREIDSVLGLPGRLWRAVEAFVATGWPILRLSRISIVAFLLGFGMLTVPEQISDLVAGLGSSDNRWRTAFFAFGAFAWSFTLWFWARWALTLEFGRDPAGLGWVRHTPRALALLGAFVAFWAAWKSTDFGSPQTVGALLSGAAIYLLTIARHQVPGLRGDERFLSATRRLAAATLGDAVATRTGGVPALRRTSSDADREVYRRFYRARRWGIIGLLWRDLMAAPFGPRCAAGLVLAAVVVGVAFTAIPEYVAPAMGAPGAALIGLAATTTLASVFILFIARHSGLPVILLLLVGGALVDSLFEVSNHDIRVLDGQPPPRRDDLRAAADAWLENCVGPAGQTTAAPVSLVLVATAGGASRAALWTTTVLDALTEVDPQLHQRLFGVSGVSGGSLGAALWTALAADAGLRCDSPPLDANGMIKRRELTRAFMGQDFLAAPLAAMMTTDPIWRHAIPFNLLPAIPHWLGARTSWTPPDRAAAMERSWEATWRAIRPDSDRFRDGFHRMWQTADGQGWDWRRPLLFLNGTHQGTGLPMVTAPVRLVVAGRPTPPNAAPSFGPDIPQDAKSKAILAPASHDLLGLVGKEIRLSTAVTNSARFPYITPSGGLRNGEASAQGEQHLPAGMRLGNVVDGGYFDNQGAGTLSDVALVLFQAFRAKYGQQRELRLMVVQITSDPDRRIGELQRCASEHWPEDETLRRYQTTAALLQGGQQPSGLDAGIAPLLAIAATQSAHTVRSSVNLARVFCGDAEAVRPPEHVSFEMVHLMLCRESPDQRIDLNWVLPERTVNYITPRTDQPHYRGAMDACDNPKELERFRAWVRNGPRTMAAGGG